MNLLIDEVPTSVMIDGTEFEINSDFRISILFELMINDNELSERERLEQALLLYYPIIPENIEEAIKQIMWFYSCGKQAFENNPKKSNGNKSKSTKRIFDYEYDSDVIFSSFLECYGINLQRDNLHWWEFRSLFDNISEETKLYKLLEIRSVNLSKVKDKDKKEYYKKMKELYKLPSEISKDEHEKLDDIGKILLEGGDISNLL